jgi:hypothetical protein
MNSTGSLPTRRRRKIQGWFAALLACAFLNACTTTRSIPAREFVQLTAIVKPGDNVDCSLRDGTHAKFKVTSVAPDALYNGATRVPVADIGHIDSTRFSPVKTGFAIGGLVIAGAIAGALASGAGMGSPGLGGI